MTRPSRLGSRRPPKTQSSFLEVAGAAFGLELGHDPDSAQGEGSLEDQVIEQRGRARSAGAAGPAPMVHLAGS
jgi:hypothetical protein